MPIPNIKPVSDLRHYHTVLREVGAGEPVFLTLNGRGRYVLMDIGDYGKRAAADWLAGELERGRKPGEEQGWTEQEKVLARRPMENKNPPF